MNLITIKGRLTKEPEMQVTSAGKEFTRISVAVNRRWNREETDFFTVTAWGKTAAFLVAYFSKGQEILLTGEMRNNRWTDKEGNHRDGWEIAVDNIEFCGSKADNNRPKAVVLEEDLPWEEEDKAF